MKKVSRQYARKDGKCKHGNGNSKKESKGNARNHKHSNRNKECL